MVIKLYSWNIYFQGIKGRSPIGAGVALLPVMLCTLPASIVTGRLLRKGISFRTLVLAGWATLLVGNGLGILWFVNTPTVAWVIIQMLCGVGQVSTISNH